MSRLRVAVACNRTLHNIPQTWMTELKVRPDGRIMHRIAEIPPLIHPFPVRSRGRLLGRPG